MKKDRMEEFKEANVFALYSSLLQTATDIKPTLETIGQ